MVHTSKFLRRYAYTKYSKFCGSVGIHGVNYLKRFNGVDMEYPSWFMITDKTFPGTCPMGALKGFRACKFAIIVAQTNAGDMLNTGGCEAL